MATKAKNINDFPGLIIIKETLEKKYGDLTLEHKNAISIVGSKLVKNGLTFNLTNAAETIQKIIHLTALGLQPELDYWALPFNGRNRETNLTIVVKWQALRDLIYARCRTKILDIEMHMVIDDYKLTVQNGETSFTYDINLTADYNYDDIKGVIAIVHFETHKKVIHLDRKELHQIKNQSYQTGKNSPYDKYPKAMAFAKLMKKVFAMLNIDYTDPNLKVLDTLDDLEFVKDTKEIKIYGNDEVKPKEGIQEIPIKQVWSEAAPRKETKMFKCDNCWITFQSQNEEKQCDYCRGIGR